MIKTQNTSAVKYHELTKGCVLLVDVNKTFKKEGAHRHDLSKQLRISPTYEMRVEEITMNGVNSFLVKGQVVHYVHPDGTPFTEEENNQYIQAQTEHYQEMFKDDSSGATRKKFIYDLSHPAVNLCHAVRIIKSGRGEIRPITKRMEVNQPSFFAEVHNEVVRQFGGKLPINLDMPYLVQLVRGHEVRETHIPSEYGRRGKVRHVTRSYPTGKIHNKRKFREAVKRNINRALYNIKDAENVDQFYDAEQIELEMSYDFNNPHDHENKIRRDEIREAFAELSKQWTVFDLPIDTDRLDRVSRPMPDHESGKTAMQVFYEAYNAIRARQYKEREKQDACDRDWDMLMHDIDQD